MNTGKPDLVPIGQPAPRRLISLARVKPTRDEIVALYRQMTVAYWAEALATRSGDYGRANEIALVRIRANRAIMESLK